MITRLHERTNAERRILVAVILWTVAYAAASFALLACTLKTFDRCLGRDGDGPCREVTETGDRGWRRPGGSPR